MARRGGFSIQKRRREAAKRLKKMEKQERRDAIREGREEEGAVDTAGDPDIAGIVPGPQPLIYPVDEED
jgi:hypothetical protein